MNSDPYSKLAQIYDKVMDHVDYEIWTSYVEGLFEKFDTETVCILDLACGTGKHLSVLSRKYKNVMGADFSMAMLKQAAENLPAAKQNSLTASNASNLAFKNKRFDVVLMLYDSINYIMEEKAVIKLLNEVSRVLRTDGIFIFDFVTKAGLKSSLKDYFETDNWDGMAYERHCWYSAKDQLQHNDFLLLYQGQSFKEEHIQKIRTWDEWKNIIAKSKMHLSEEFSNFSKLPPNKRSERIHMVCRKEEQ